MTCGGISISNEFDARKSSEIAELLDIIKDDLDIMVGKMEQCTPITARIIVEREKKFLVKVGRESSCVIRQYRELLQLFVHVVRRPAFRLSLYRTSHGRRQ